MNFTLQCPCGDTLQIAGTDAACTRQCRCGAEFQIPRLTELRRLEANGESTIAPRRVGEAPGSPLPAATTRCFTVAQKLQLLSVEGCLPVETRCVQCELSTDQVLDCYIECELPHVTQTGRFWDHFVTVALLIIAPLHALFHFMRKTEEESAIVSDEVVVRAPLRICADCAARLRRQKQVVRELLLKMPLYQPLLRQYPDANINLPNR